MTPREQYPPYLHLMRLNVEKYMLQWNTIDVASQPNLGLHRHPELLQFNNPQNGDQLKIAVVIL